MCLISIGVNTSIYLIITYATIIHMHGIMVFGMTNVLHKSKEQKEMKTNESLTPIDNVNFMYTTQSTLNVMEHPTMLIYLKCILSYAIIVF